MRRLPTEIKLTDHAKQRLEERKDPEVYYNTKNLMKSSCKWYIKEDLIMDSALYRHCCYVCRKSNQMAYMTDGKIEILYNKNTKVAITILEVKEKFLPITQYIKPELLEYIDKKREDKRVNNDDNTIVNIGNTILTYYKVYKSLVENNAKEIAKIENKSNTYNIVYREKIKKPMTISELYGV